MGGKTKQREEWQLWSNERAWAEAIEVSLRELNEFFDFGWLQSHDTGNVERFSAADRDKITNYTPVQKYAVLSKAPQDKIPRHSELLAQDLNRSYDLK